MKWEYGKTKENIGNLMDHSIEQDDSDLTQFTKGELYWYGCYGSFRDWRNYVTPESYAHPAKMSPKLCDRIFKHLKQLGLLQEGMTIIDFMSGIGTTSIMASLHGLDSVGVELEPHFIKMQETNRQKCKDRGISRKWEILQGDSRKLSELLKEKGYAGVVSPPYAEQEVSLKARADKSATWIRNETGQKHIGYTQDNNPSNIGNQHGENYLSAMLQVYQEAYKSGISPIALVTKNPTRKGKLRRLDIDTAKLLMTAGYEIYDYHRAVLFEEHQQATLTGEVKKQVRGRLSFFKRLSMQKGSPVAQWEDVIIAVIPQTAERESNMAGVTSPPFAESLTYHSEYPPDKFDFVKGRKAFEQETGKPAKYGTSEGQIGTMPYKIGKKKEVSP